MDDIVARLDGEHDEDALQAEIAELHEQLAWAERVLTAKETTLAHLLARSLADTTRSLLSFLNEGRSGHEPHQQANTADPQTIQPPALPPKA